MPTFLLIDDEAAILRLLSGMVSESFADAKILTAENGHNGFELALREKPDIILLDIVLPDISGVEVCRRIKSHAALRHIPVIFITGACTQTMYKAIGLDTGADCYLRKPIDQGEFIAQINTMLRIKQSDDLLRSQKRDLEEAFRKQTEDLHQSQEVLAQKIVALEKLVKRQTQELIQADRLSAMGILSAGIAHEINNPNTFIASNLQTFRLFWEHVQKTLDHPEQCTDADRQRLDFIRREMAGLINGMEEGNRRITAIVRGMKNYLSGNKAEHRVVDPREVVESALRLIHNQLKRDIEVKIEFAPDLPRVFGSEQMLGQVFVNLMLNAAAVMKEYRGAGTLLITGRKDNGYAAISVRDNGPGMDQETLKNLFNPFFTLRRNRGGTGLGLFISHGIIKGHNGVIEVESQPGHGAVFIVKLPAIEKDQSLDVEVENTEPESELRPATKEAST